MTYGKRIATGVLSLCVVAACAAADSAVTPDWHTPRRFTELGPHPRLYVTPAQLERMIQGRGEGFEQTYATIAAAADTGVRDAQTPMQNMTQMQRGFTMQGRMTALAIQWHLTRDRRYLEAALKNVEGMIPWMREGSIDLWTGQHIAAVAITYDLLYNDMTPEERAWMVGVAREHFMKPFLQNTAQGRNMREHGERGSWWMGIISNWNPVSITGGGLLALTMYDELDEAQTAIDRVNASYQPIFDYLQETEGGWVEGLGYWNWTIHYMSLFLISYERTTGEQHEGFRSPGFRRSLTFGTYFVANGEACGFGDNQHGNISDSLPAAAEHLGDAYALRRLKEHFLLQEQARSFRDNARSAAQPPTPVGPAEQPVNVNPNYGVPQRVLLHPERVSDVAEIEPHMVKFFPRQGWGMVADQWPRPNVYGAIRGGQLGGAHTHLDLLSWHGVVGNERMIHTINEAGYYTTAWQGRALEIYERNSAAKNTIFIGGLGAYPRSQGARWRPVAEGTSLQLPTGPALRLDATAAFWLTRSSPRLVGRLITTVDDKGLLVLDRVLGTGSNPVEVRAHTNTHATFGETDVLLQGEFQTARMTFAADQPAVLREATALLTNAQATPPTVLRWQTRASVRNVTMASFLSRGDEPIDLQVTSDEHSVTVTIAGADWNRQVRLTSTLELRED